jgi:hypothetical protein
VKTPTLYMTGSHPLASVAADHCEPHTDPLIGGVACGRCWETAISDDERFAVENNLPREIVTDPLLIDDVAVERAIHGEPVHLTPAEQTSAILVLRSKGTTLAAIARLLRTNQQSVWRDLQSAEVQPSDHVADEVGAA